jgi:hypothetical protein
MRSPLPLRVAACALVCALALAGCASAPLGPPIEAPRLAVGDHWHYRVTDNLRRGSVSQLDAEVIAVSGPAARVQLTVTDPYGGRTTWVDEIEGGGALRAGTLWREPPRPFKPPVQLLAFPLTDGKTWRQVIPTFRRDIELPDQILVYGKVDGRRTVKVPAGAFDAVYVYRVLQLDDEEFWRTRTTRRDAVWYAPEVKAPVREAREAEYTEKGGADFATVRTESTVIELESFRPGR